MANTIQTKYSPQANAPTALAPGELAWAKGRGLYIGEDNGLITLIAMSQSFEALQEQLANLQLHVARLHGNQSAIETLLDPTLTMDRLGAWLADMTHQSQFQTLLYLPMMIHAFMDSPGLLAMLSNNSTAMTTIVNSPDALKLLTDNSTAMLTLWASNAATDALWASTNARLAVWNSDAALAALQANPTQIARQIALGKVNTATTVTDAITILMSKKIILLRRYLTGSTTASEWLQWSRDGVNDAMLPTGTVLNTSGSIAKGRTTTYANSSIYPGANNDNANAVCAMNGLRRGGTNVTATLNLIYLSV
jgi:hypothetical protein